MSLSKGLAALLVVVFVVFTLVVIMAWSVRADLLNADVYVDVLDEAGFFEVPYLLIRDGEIPQVGGLLLKEGPLAAISGADREAIARELAPPNWVRAQLERAIRDLLAVAADPEVDELPDLVISVSEIKTRALGEPGDQALSLVVEKLPDCAPGQAPFDLDPDTPFCKPVGVDVMTFWNQLKPSLPPLVARLPDTYRLSWQPQQREVLEELQRAGQVLDQLQVLLLLLVALNLALLGIIWSLTVRSPAEWLRWTGGPLLLLGLLTLALALPAPRAVAWWLENSPLWADVNIPAHLDRVLELAIVDLAVVLFRPAVLAGVALAAVGLLLVLLSPLFPGRRRRPSSRLRSVR
jgi:hypothetical protein